MRIFFLILSVSSLSFLSCFSQGESKQKNIENNKQQALVSISMKPGGSFLFNTFNNYSRGIEFKNITNKDTIVTKTLSIDKPVYIVYGNILVVPIGDPVLRTYGLLLNPGDTVILKQGIDGAISMQYSSGLPDFIDSLISVPKDFYWHHGMQQRNDLKAIGLNGMVQNIEGAFKKNEAAISNLHLSEKRANILSNLNGIVKYTAIAHLLLEPNVADSKFTDSLHEEMLRHLDNIRSIKLNNYIIYRAIIAYNAKKQNGNLNKNDYWGCVSEADQQLKRTDMFEEYLISNVAYTFIQTPKEIVGINKDLQTVHTKDPFLDTLYQLTNILLETSTNFKKAKRDLETFAGGRFNFLITDNEKSSNHEMKTLSGLPPVNLYSFRGNKFDFKRIVLNKKYKLTVVDLWASWCVPCIMEMPHLKKMEERFKSKPIQFVTISIDKETDIGKWVEAAKKNGIYNKPNQYRLANFKESPLTKLLNIKNIPRYLVINNEGKILDYDFYRPSNDSFELELLKYLD